MITCNGVFQCMPASDGASVGIQVIFESPDNASVVSSNSCLHCVAVQEGPTAGRAPLRAWAPA